MAFTHVCFIWKIVNFFFTSSVESVPSTEKLCGLVIALEELSTALRSKNAQSEVDGFLCPMFLQLLEIAYWFPCPRYHFPTIGNLDAAIDQGTIFFLVRGAGTGPSPGQTKLSGIWIMETKIKGITIDLTLYNIDLKQ